MIGPELVARIRHLFFAEHWKVGTIAAELRLQAIRCAGRSRANASPGPKLPDLA